MHQVFAGAVIFDLDGVLVDSRPAVDAAWTEWGKLHGLRPAAVLRTIPGMRTRDAVVALAPELDPDAEAAAIVEREYQLAHRVIVIPGAADLLARLPPGRWGIATSGTERIARSRLMEAGLVAPPVFVTAEMVTRGKPDPQVYLRAASALGVAPAQCVVFEDAPPGIASARSAGCEVIGVLTWAERELLATPITIHDLRDVEVAESPRGIQLRFKHDA